MIYLISPKITNYIDKFTNNVIDMNGMLYNCSSLICLNLSNFNTNNVNNMSYMFFCCSSLTFFNLSNFNINNIKISILCSLVVLL